MYENDDIDKLLSNQNDTGIQTSEISELKDIEFGNINYYTWGIEGMPERLGCFDRQDLVVLAGYPSCGKTEFTFFVARMNAMSHKKVLYISLELPVQQMVQRIARKKAGIGKADRQNQNISEQQMDIMTNEFNKVKDLQNLKIVSYKSSPTVEMLEDTIKRYHKAGFDLFFIDNLGKIAGDNNENIRFDNITSRLQDLKNNLNTCIRLLHHLSKPGKQQSYLPGGVGGIRGSQKIVDNSSLVFELYRDLDPDSEQEDKRKVQLILYKDTMDGATGTTLLQFNKGDYEIYNKLEQGRKN